MAGRSEKWIREVTPPDRGQRTLRLSLGDEVTIYPIRPNGRERTAPDRWVVACGADESTSPVIVTFSSYQEAVAFAEHWAAAAKRR